MNAHEIMPDVAVGSYTALDEMHARGWRSICFADDIGEVAAHRHVQLIDGGGNDPEKIELGINWITDEWRSGNKVFSCCRHGMNRSAIMMAAAMTIAGRTLWLMDGLKLIHIRREIVSARDTTLSDVLTVVKKIKGI